MGSSGQTFGGTPGAPLAGEGEGGGGGAGNQSSEGVGGDTAAIGGGAGSNGGMAGIDAGGEGGSSGNGGVQGQSLPEGVITDVAYTCSSPFEGVVFPAYFYLEDWEDSLLNTPGVTSSSSTVSSSFGVSNLIDSVDCDDGVNDGTCLDCDALYADGSVELSFDAQILGGLPTHVGMVWTDGGPATSTTLTGYDALDKLIYTRTIDGVGDDSIYNTTSEDRFFGIVFLDGIKRVTLTNSLGGIEVDHLQYGR